MELNDLSSPHFPLPRPLYCLSEIEFPPSSADPAHSPNGGPETRPDYPFPFRFPWISSYLQHYLPLFHRKIRRFSSSRPLAKFPRWSLGALGISFVALMVNFVYIINLLVEYGETELEPVDPSQPIRFVRYNPDGSDGGEGAGSGRLGIAGDLGAWAIFQLMLTLFLVPRYNPITMFIPLNRSFLLTFHVWLSRLVLFLLLLHGLLASVVFSDYGQLWPELFDDFPFSHNSLGLLALFFGFLMFFSSFSSIRRSSYFLFHLFHYISIPFFLIFSIIHENDVFLYIFIPMVFILGDYYIRYSSMKSSIIIERVSLLPGSILSLEFSKPSGGGVGGGWRGKEAFHSSYSTGQYIELYIPSISKWEFHPFSLSSAPYQDSLCVQIKLAGRWTKKLQETIFATPGSLIARPQRQLGEEEEERGQDEHREHLNSSFSPSVPLIFFSPPVGTAPFPLCEYEVIIFLAGGIGISPLQARFNEIVHYYRSRDSLPSNTVERFVHPNLSHLHMVWASKFVEMPETSASTVSPRKLQGNSPPPTLPPAFAASLLTEIHSPPVNAQDSSDSSEIVHTDFYVTACPPPIAENPEHFHAQFGRSVHVGRPPLIPILSSAAQFAHLKEIRRLAVFCCGPEDFLIAANFAAGQVRKEFPHFSIDFHEESFTN